MKRAIKYLIIVTLPFLPVVASAQFRPAKCEVQPLWVGKNLRSSNFGLMGSFETDGENVIRSFRLEDSNLIATVGISYVRDYSKKKRHSIRLAIAVSDREQKEIFEAVGSSEAKTQYRKGWNLAVTTNVHHDDLIYMFILRCWDARSKRPFI